MATEWFYFLLMTLMTLMIGFGQPLHANSTHIGLAVGLVQDTRSTSSKDTLQNTLVDGYIFTPLFKTKSFFLGAEYMMITTSMPNGADDQTATLVANNPMMALKLSLDRNGFFSLSVMGSPYVSATYNVTGGVANDTWTGQAFAGKFSYHAELSSAWKVTTSLTYFSASYSSKSSTSTSSVSSFSRTLLIPNLGLEVYF